MRIAVDAMGSDNHPTPDVEGSVWAAREFGEELILVGDEPTIAAELAKHDTNGLKITIYHAREAVTMLDKPRDVVRGKPNSSMHAGMQLLKDGQADAFITAGNTGAALAIAMLGPLRRISGVKRAALGVLFPVPGRPLLIDGGATADSTADQLLQFAQMGSIYITRMNGIERPRVALVSNGEEESKGNKVIQEAMPLLQNSGLNYVGNIEPKEFMQGMVDVAVTDGFVGNIMMKTAEATARLLADTIRTEIKANPLSAMGGLLIRSAMKRVSKQLDPHEVGGAPLLGLDGVVIVGHGRSNAYAIKQAVGQARRVVEADVVQAIRDGLGTE
ncbi:MAG: phosphate acyltransferase PlsX [Anaerolineales bacterium]|nr:phosphate acyltransferase PlsX [Anaerolineales bacterium]